MRCSQDRPGTPSQSLLKRFAFSLSLFLSLHGTLRTSILRARAEVERATLSARQELIGSNDQEMIQRRKKQSDEDGGKGEVEGKQKKRLDTSCNHTSHALNTLCHLSSCL